MRRLGKVSFTTRIVAAAATVVGLGAMTWTARAADGGDTAKVAAPTGVPTVTLPGIDVTTAPAPTTTTTTTTTTPPPTTTTTTTTTAPPTTTTTTTTTPPATTTTTTTPPPTTTTTTTTTPKTDGAKAPADGDAAAGKAADGDAAAGKAAGGDAAAPDVGGPAATDDQYTTDAGKPLTVGAPGLLANDRPTEGGQLVARPGSKPGNGTADVKSDGSFTYTPRRGFTGTDSFGYQSCEVIFEGPTTCVDASVTIMVKERVTAVPADDAYSVDGGRPLTVPAPGVLANDGPAGAPLVANTFSRPSHGDLTPAGGSGGFTYVPATGFTGTDRFTYQACLFGRAAVLDGSCRTATVTIDVRPPPVAVPTDDTYTTDQDIPLTVLAPGVLANDGPAGVALVARGFGGPDHGSLTKTDDRGGFTYVPADGFAGTDHFTYEACRFDGELLLDESCRGARVSIDVRPPPVAIATDDSYVTDENTPFTVPAPGVLANDGPAEVALVVATFGPPDHGQLTGTDEGGGFTYRPTPDYAGPDAFSYRACIKLDGEVRTASCRTATVRLDVRSVDHPPRLGDDHAETPEDTPLSVPSTALLANDHDVEGEKLTVEDVGDAAHGTAKLDKGELVYTPDRDYSGDDDVTYRACTPHEGPAGDTDCSTATLHITVSSVDDPPVAADDTATTPEDTALDAPAPGVLANDHDVDDIALTATLRTAPVLGTVTLGHDGGYHYQPHRNANGRDTFTYSVCDPAGKCAPATVTIDVVAQDDPPTAAPDTYQAHEDNRLDGTPSVLANDSDVDSTTLRAQLVTPTTHGQLALRIDGTFLYQPDPDYAGPDAFVYRACDATSCAAATASIDVIAEDDPPSASDDAYTAVGTVLAVAAPGVLGNDTDPDSKTLTARGASVPSHGTVELDATGAFRYTPDPGFSGTDTFSYRSCDATSCDTAVVTITVAPPPPPPPTTTTTTTTSTPRDGGKPPPGKAHDGAVPTVPADSATTVPAPGDASGTDTHDGGEPTAAGAVSVEPAVLSLAQSATVTGHGCVADGPVELAVDGAAVGQVTPDAAGTFQARLDVGAVAPGRHTLIARCRTELHTPFDVAVTSNVRTDAGTVLSLSTFSFALLGLLWRPLRRMF